ncbi:hypothetical protein H5T87_02530 [bacterium]|nr:hypothetical protein [bacterium]
MSILGFTSATSAREKWRLSFKMKVIAPPILSIFPYLYHTNRIGMRHIHLRVLALVDPAGMPLRTTQAGGY